MPASLNGANFSDNLVYSTETQFALCQPCHHCQGTGTTQDPSKQFDTSLSQDAKRCTDCDGRGWHPKFMTADHLFQLLMPEMFDELMRQLPEILERTKFAVVESIMNS